MRDGCPNAATVCILTFKVCMGLASDGSPGVVQQQVELGSGFRTQLANPSLLADTELLRQAKASVRGISALGQSARRRLPGAATRQSQHPPWASCIAEMAPCYALT